MSFFKAAKTSDINDIMLMIYTLCDKGGVQVTRGPSLTGGNFI